MSPKYPVYPDGPPPSPTPKPPSEAASLQHIPGSATDLVGMSGLDDTDADFLNVAQLPNEVVDRILSRSDPSIYTLGSELTRYRNDLTKDPRGHQQEWNFVLFPLTTQKFLITRCGIVYNLSTMTSTLRKAFLSTFPILRDTRPQSWYSWYTSLENHCSTHHLYLPPIDETRRCNDDKGFKVGEHRFGDDVDFPFHFSARLTLYEKILHQGLVHDNSDACTRFGVNFWTQIVDTKFTGKLE